VTTPDRQAYLAACEAEAMSAVAPERVPEDARTHQDEMAAAHAGRPAVAVQNATHGSPAPAPDYGPDPRGGVTG
jgi:hypothetical protein